MRALIASLLLFAAPAAATPSQDLQKVIDEHWAAFLEANPVYATSLGVRRFDARIGDLTLAAMDAEAMRAKGFLDRLQAIPDADLSPADRTNKGVLARMLKDQVEGNTFGQRMMLFTTYAGWHQGFAGMADSLPFRTRADYESYLTRLGQYPKLNTDAIAISRQALAKGYVQPCDALGGFEDTITGAVAGPPEGTRFYEPFTRSKSLDLYNPLI